jgi:uncharacterized protein
MLILFIIVLIRKFQILFIHFVSFVKKPNEPDYLSRTTRQKWIEVGFYYLIIDFVICGFLLWYPVEIAEKLGLFNKLKGIDLKLSVAYEILLTIILAPLIEEGIFRLFLGYIRTKSYFKWSYYISAIVFGLIHISNYDIDETHYLFIPFITMTQMFGGLILGFIRINYGFWYGILSHVLFNSVAIIWDYVFGFDI